MSSVRMLVRILSSSSTSTTIGFGSFGTLLGSFFRLFQRNPDVKRGSLAPFAFEIDRSAVVLRHGPAHQHQAEARADANRFGRESLLQDLRLVFFPNPMTGVGH